MLHDADHRPGWAPIQKLPGALAPIELHNSPLSELATLGFEYGYSAAAPEVLVLWEAQFGDFINGAQVIVDQFLSAGLSKWGLTTRLTLLLPHGYEGQGPEHSSARLERFLQLAAEGNIRVANPTTPAQYFHLLRRQARRTRQRPLVVMTPKSLLRLPQANSKLEDLADGAWRPVLDDPSQRRRQPDATRMVLCSGKIYYDLLAEADKMESGRPALVRLEQLYSFPWTEMRAMLARYPQAGGAGLGAGGAAEHGRVDLRGAEAARAGAGDGVGGVLRRAARAGESGRGLPGRAHGGAEPDHPGGAGDATADGVGGARQRSRRRDDARAERARGRLAGRPLSSAPSPAHSFASIGRSEACRASSSKRLREVFPVVQEEHPARAALHEKRDQRRVRLGRVAVPAGEDQIVRPVVRGLAATGTNVVQGDCLRRGLGAAIGAHRAMLCQKPIAMRLHGSTGGTAEAGDGDCGMST